MFKRLRDQTFAVILSALIPVTSFAQTFRPNEGGSPSQIPQAEIGNTPIQINLETISPQSFSQLNSQETLPAIPKENEALRLKAPIQESAANPTQKTLSPIPASPTSKLSPNNEESAQKSQAAANGHFGRAYLFLKNIQKNLPWKNSDPKMSLPSEDGKNPSIAPIQRSDVQIFVPVSKIVSHLKNLAQENPAAAWAKAKEILNDASEKRLVVRSSALDILATAPVSEFFPAVLDLLKTRYPQQWYLAREAAKIIGERAADLSAEQRAAAIASLKSIPDPKAGVLSIINADAEKTRLAKLLSWESLYNMSQWSLEQMGEKPSDSKTPALSDSPLPPVLKNDPGAAKTQKACDRD